MARKSGVLGDIPCLRELGFCFPFSFKLPCCATDKKGRAPVSIQAGVTGERNMPPGGGEREKHSWRWKFMMRRFLLGILWSIAIYFGACFLVGVVAGAVAGAYDPVHATAAGMEAGALAVASIRLYLIFGALFVGTTGTMIGFLPAGRAKPGAVTLTRINRK